MGEDRCVVALERVLRERHTAHEAEVPLEPHVARRGHELGMTIEQLAPALAPRRACFGRRAASRVVEHDQIATRITMCLQPIRVDEIPSVVERRSYEQGFELVAGGHVPSYRRLVAAVLVIDRSDLQREVCELSETRMTTLGGSRDDIDLGLDHQVASIVLDAGTWRLDRSDGSTTAMAHGQLVDLSRVQMRLLVADDLAAAVEEDRYLRTAVDPMTNTFRVEW